MLPNNRNRQLKIKNNAKRFAPNPKTTYSNIIQHGKNGQFVTKKIKNSKLKRETKKPIRQTKNPLLDTTDFKPNNYTQIHTPIWLTIAKKTDVSIIVPLYKSEKVVIDLMKSWDFEDYGLTTEIIFVDDQCPNNSKSRLLEMLMTFEGKPNLPTIKIFQTVVNSGFGSTCNLGAYHATGNYLIFLNADTLVTKNWIKPIVEILKDKTVGIVGNLQLKKGGKWDGYIDGAGSEWHWHGTVFHHIGRHSYNYKTLDKPFHPNDCPPDVIDKPREVEMVTGCCFGIRKEVFERVGGFDLNYKIGYWEDSEICMSVKELGYKIMFTPESKIYHILSHSNSGGHSYQDHNKNYFMNKWVKSGRIDDLINNKRSEKPKVSSIYLKRSGASGDVLVASAVVKALKNKHRGCQIYFETVLPDILKNHPEIKGIVDQQIESKINCDLYYNLDMAYEVRPKCNILDAYCQVVGVKPEDCDFSLSTTLVNNLPKNFIVIHAGYNTPWAGRQWSHANFIQLAERLNKEYEVVCIGKSGDFSIPCNLDLRGKTDVNQLAYVMKNAKLFVGVDSLPFHVAQFMNTPGVCFFGAIDPLTRIYRKNMHAVFVKNLKCLGCHHRKTTPCTSTTKCETNLFECTNNLTVDDMYNEIKHRLEEYNGRS